MTILFEEMPKLDVYKIQLLSEAFVCFESPDVAFLRILLFYPYDSFFIIDILFYPQSAFYPWSAVCILPSVCILPLVCSL